MSPGYFTPRSSVCMPPIELPITTRRCFTPRCSLHQPVLRVDHVVVVVLREVRAQPVGWLARLAGADRVGNDDVVAARVERLAGAEQLAREGRRQHARGRTRRAMQDQDRLAGRRADRHVVDAQLGQHLAGVEAEVAIQLPSLGAG